MKHSTVMAALAASAVLGGAGAAWAVPVVSNVEMQQVAGRRVQITYDLAGEDAIVTLSIETNSVAIPDSAVTLLTGDVNKMVTAGEGSKSIMWNAGADWPENITDEAKARVTAWCIDAPPQVMVVDLTGGKDAETYPVAYFTRIEALPGGVTNAVYKSSYLVLNKIIKGRFNMGAGVCEVVLTKDFYTGVFEVTQGQWAQVMGNWPSYWNNADWRVTRPVEQVTYNEIRGSASGAGWPGSSAVDAGSFMEKLRTKTGQVGFDLPTEAQWEYACRASTLGEFNDGSLSGDLNARMNLLGRYELNGGKIGGVDPLQGCTTENATASVGSYVPNAWGLYDMHGNVREWCLDWFAGAMTGSDMPGGHDPVGPASGSWRVLRGGNWERTAVSCRSMQRGYDPPSSPLRARGFRLVRNIAQ